MHVYEDLQKLKTIDRTILLFTIAKKGYKHTDK